MTSIKSKLPLSPCWQKLEQKQQAMSGFSISKAFGDNNNRANEFATEACGIFFDYSKHLIDTEAFELLQALAHQQGLQEGIQRLFNGSIVNPSESRQALHWLLRKTDGSNLSDELKADWADIQNVKQRMKAISNAIITGDYRSMSDEPFTDVVHIGIGGSDLGPAMVYQALKPYQQQTINCHFISNICAHDIQETLSKLNAQTTLFIVASKSFTTLETLQNAKTAKEWFIEKTGNNNGISQHFFAVSTNIKEVTNWGIDEDKTYPFGDYVGGRYSLWSAIGLTLAIGLGFDNFDKLLSGAEQMDEHFQSAELPHNLPVIMALLGIWYTNFYQRQNQAVIPYDHRLRRFPAFLQQLEMESNGKQANLNNELIDYATCPDIFGEAGTNSQHSFFQQFHQGTEFTPIDFIAVCENTYDKKEHRDWLIANCLAQSRTLMLGQETDNSEKFIPGNRPSSTLMMDKLSPERLGSLIALYEHKVYAQSVIWNINPFDQWGVQLGKTISKSIYEAFNGSNLENSDGSTELLIQRYHDKKD